MRFKLTYLYKIHLIDFFLRFYFLYFWPYLTKTSFDVFTLIAKEYFFKDENIIKSIDFPRAIFVKELWKCPLQFLDLFQDAIREISHYVNLMHKQNLQSLLHIKINEFWEHKMSSLQIRKTYFSSHVFNLITCMLREKDFSQILPKYLVLGYCCSHWMRKNKLCENGNEYMYYDCKTICFLQKKNKSKYISIRHDQIIPLTKMY